MQPSASCGHQPQTGVDYGQPHTQAVSLSRPRWHFLLIYPSQLVTTASPAHAANHVDAHRRDSGLNRILGVRHGSKPGCTSPSATCGSRSRMIAGRSVTVALTITIEQQCYCLSACLEETGIIKQQIIRENTTLNSALDAVHRLCNCAPLNTAPARHPLKTSTSSHEVQFPCGTATLDHSTAFSGLARRQPTPL